MVNSLLDVVRIEAGALKPDLAPISPRELVLASVQQLTPLAKAGGLDLVVDLPDDLPAIVADDDLVCRVLVNLIHNAIKFTPPGGRIAVQVALEGPARVEFSVRDTGDGIAPEECETIFDRFAQAKSRAGKGHASAGLGLTFCRLAVEAHGGTIWVESTPGDGSCFRFRLPQYPQEG
jgi:two-component system phosphate regulon sensor histidine kinase PhoR